MSKKKISLFDEVKKAKNEGEQKDFKKFLNKMKEEKDLELYFNVFEIEYLYRENYLPEGLEKSKILFDKTSTSTDTSPEMKELANVTAYLYCQFALALEQDVDTLKILSNIKDEPSTDTTVTAIKSVWPGMYIEIRGLIGDSYLKQKDYKNALNSYTELYTQVKNFSKVMDLLDDKSLYSTQKRILGIPKVLLLQGLVTDSITKLREMLAAKDIKLHPRVIHDMKRELAKVLARFGTNDVNSNFPRNSFEESLQILVSLTNEECFDTTIFDDLVLLLSSKRYYLILSDILQNSLIKNFRDKKLWNLTGHALMSAGKYQEALSIFNECLTFNEDPKLLLLCSKIYLNNLNDIEKALEYVNRASKSSEFWKLKCNLHYGIIYSLLALKETSLQGRQNLQLRSLDYLLKAAETDSNDSMINYQIALQYAELREIKKAFNYVRLSLQNQSHIQGWILLANLYSATKDFSNVSQTIKTALFEFENNTLLLLIQAEVEELENETKAFKSYKSIVDSLEKTEQDNPYTRDELEIFLRISNAYRRMKRFTEASELIKKKNLELLGSEYHFINGRILEDTKKLTEALEEYQNCILLTPNHVGAQERMGIIYSLTPQNLVLAKSFLQSSVRLDPTSFEAWYHLGVVTKKMGDFEEASDSFITSIKLQKTSPLIPFTSLKRNI